MSFDEFDDPSTALVSNPNTVVADGGEEGEDVVMVRRLSARECARLQSFGDEFVFEGSESDMYEQIGNAVPPLLMEAVAGRVRELLQ